MPTQTVFGVVDPHGDILAGSGFTVKNVKPGEYSISFSQAFSSFPTVVATQGGNFRDANNLDGVAVGNLGADQVTILTGNSAGGAQNRQFSFIAMGAT